MSDTQTPELAAAASVKAAESFWADLKSVSVNHYKWFLGVAGGIVLVVGFNWVRDMRNELANQKQVIGTLSQQYQQIGHNAVAANSQAPAAQVSTDAVGVFGHDVMQLMAAQGAAINSLTTATGTISSQVSSLRSQLPQYRPTEQSTDQGVTRLTGYPLEQSRKDGPPLASVNLFYDPRQTDPNKAFAGTTWQSYAEEFKASTGQWEKTGDGGFRTTVALSRTVSRPDPNNPGKFIPVGFEQIPISGASTVYTPTGILDGQKTVVPRWTANLGLSRNTTGYGLAGSVDYRVTDRYGLWVGAANNSAMGGVSVRFGAPKK